VTRGGDVPVALIKTVDAFGRLNYAFNNAGAEQQRNPIADIELLLCQAAFGWRAVTSALSAW
jgi:hypothetical protein